MEYYKNEIKEVFKNKIAEGYETKEQILNRWENGETENDFGNLTWSRFCSPDKAKEALKQAGFPSNEELNNLLEEVDCKMDILNKGAEVIDVILCELCVPYVVAELREEE